MHRARAATTEEENRPRRHEPNTMHGHRGMLNLIERQDSGPLQSQALYYVLRPQSPFLLELDSEHDAWRCQQTALPIEQAVKERYHVIKIDLAKSTLLFRVHVQTSRGNSTRILLQALNTLDFELWTTAFRRMLRFQRGLANRRRDGPPMRPCTDPRQPQEKTPKKDKAKTDRRDKTLEKVKRSALESAPNRDNSDTNKPSHSSNERARKPSTDAKDKQRKYSDHSRPRKQSADTKENPIERHRKHSADHGKSKRTSKENTRPKAVLMRDQGTSTDNKLFEEKAIKPKIVVKRNKRENARSNMERSRSKTVATAAPTQEKVVQSAQTVGRTRKMTQYFPIPQTKNHMNTYTERKPAARTLHHQIPSQIPSSEHSAPVQTRVRKNTHEINALLYEPEKLVATNSRNRQNTADMNKAIYEINNPTPWNGNGQVANSTQPAADTSFKQDEGKNSDAALEAELQAFMQSCAISFSPMAEDSPHHRPVEPYWRYGEPDYTQWDAEFQRGKISSHEPGGIEDQLQNLLQLWEKESVHVLSPTNWESIKGNTADYYVQINDGTPLTAHTAQSTPNLGLLHACTSQDVEGHDINEIACAFEHGMQFEIVEIVTMGEHVSFSWRQWGLFNGTFQGTSGADQLIEVQGFCSLSLSPHFTLQSLRLWCNLNALWNALREAAVLATPSYQLPTTTHNSYTIDELTAHYTLEEVSDDGAVFI